MRIYGHGIIKIEDKCARTMLHMLHRNIVLRRKTKLIMNPKCYNIRRWQHKKTALKI